jgi:hypothetical protein
MKPLSRRDAMMAFLFGGSMLGLRSLVTGLPVKMLLDPKKALADLNGQCTADQKTAAQFFIVNTSGLGDPFSCNSPGTYDDPVTGTDLSTLVHPDENTYAYMKRKMLSIGGKSYTAAGVWSTLFTDVAQDPLTQQPFANVGGRTSLCHIMTNTPVHPKEPNVLSLMGATYAAEMFPSILAKAMAPCLGTLQTQPISVGATTPSESLTFNGQALPTIPPTALAATLSKQTGTGYAGMSALQGLRDSTLNGMYTSYKDPKQTTPAQRAFIDSLVSAQSQARGQTLQDQLAALISIKANDSLGQITAAVALIQMGVSPVIAVHFPFGGDNHADTAFAAEAAQSQTGMQAIVGLLATLQAKSLQDSVSFINLNVFGRTMAAYNTQGRQHNQNHELSIMIGKPFRSIVAGGLAPVDTVGNPLNTPTDPKFFDWGCTGMKTDGTSTRTPGSTDIANVDTLASWGKTVLTAVGVPSDQVNTTITGGSVITGCIQS